MDWKRLLAYIAGSVDQELLLQNEYLANENRLLHDQIKGRVRLSDGERKALAEIGRKLSGIIKARAMCCSFLRSATPRSEQARFGAVNGLAGC
jgi:hypothetical protein